MHLSQAHFQRGGKLFLRVLHNHRFVNSPLDVVRPSCTFSWLLLQQDQYEGVITIDQAQNIFGR